MPLKLAFGQLPSITLEENMNKPFAGFGLRFLASLNDSAIGLLIHVVFLNYIIASSNSLSQLAFNLVLYLILIFLPVSILSYLIYYAWFISNFGGTFGKLLTGLEVTDDSGKKLSYKRSFFRSTVGFTFSSLFLWLGFFSIIKDPKKQGWHDKAVGSIVVVRRNLWIISLISLALLIFINWYLISSGITKLMNSPIKNDFQSLISSLKENPTQKASPDNTSLIQSSPLPIGITDKATQSTSLGYTTTDVNNLINDLAQADKDYQILQQDYKGHVTYNQKTVDQILNIIIQRKTSIQKLLDIMGKGQPLTKPDITVWDQLDSLTKQQDTLVSNLSNGNGGF